MIVIDLCSGLGGFSQAFLDSGHEIIRIDNNPIFKKVPFTLVQDIRDFEYRDNIDVVLASPPCQCFSILACSYYWTKDGKPKRQETYRAIRFVWELMELIDRLNPRYYFVENPRGMMATLGFMKKYPRHLITYCQYGAKYQKPTYIWSNAKWYPRKPCRRGDPCHEPGPRGARTGLQGFHDCSSKIIKSSTRAKIPYQLSDEIRLLIESDPGTINQYVLDLDRDQGVTSKASL